jgi:hypothetical protein
VNNLFEQLREKNIELPEDILHLLNNCKSFTVFNTIEELAVAAVGGDNPVYEVKYDIPGHGEITEAIVHRVSNGISANYVDPYMRRRDPDTMAIADDLPTDKERFKDRFGYDFGSLKKETLDWLSTRDLGVFFYFAGRESSMHGILSLRQSFFAMGLLCFTLNSGKLKKVSMIRY